jgi:hypothetical protein
MSVDTQLMLCNSYSRTEALFCSACLRERFPAKTDHLTAA